jgi:hypothetical protein
LNAVIAKHGHLFRLSLWMKGTFSSFNTKTAATPVLTVQITREALEAAAVVAHPHRANFP